MSWRHKKEANATVLHASQMISQVTDCLSARTKDWRARERVESEISRKVHKYTHKHMYIYMCMKSCDVSLRTFSIAYT